MISAIVITIDEELMLTDCLKSVAWVDEILVVDTGSTDRTIDIAKKHKARVIEYKSGKSFSDWRNRGLKEAKGDWILYIDADERVTEKLHKEILEVISSNNEYSAYAIPRINMVFGQALMHGGWYPDYVKRLYKKDKLKKWTGDLHEEPDFKGTMGHLKHAFVHEKHETFRQMLEKTNNWSAIEAKLMFDANHPPMNFIRFSTASFREFWKRMIVGRAFLDGRIGIMMALYQVFSRFISYAKLWEMQTNASSNL